MSTSGLSACDTLPFSLASPAGHRAAKAVINAATEEIRPVNAAMYATTSAWTSPRARRRSLSNDEVDIVGRSVEVVA
jgi:hypothetical protein